MLLIYDHIHGIIHEAMKCVNLITYVFILNTERFQYLLLLHLMMDMYVEKSHLVALLLPQSKIAVNYYCCIPNDSYAGTCHV